MSTAAWFVDLYQLFLIPNNRYMQYKKYVFALQYCSQQKNKDCKCFKDFFSNLGLNYVS